MDNLGISLTDKQKHIKYRWKIFYRNVEILAQSSADFALT